MSAPPDPVFAAIERHRAAWVHLEATCTAAAADAELEGARLLHQTVPTTLAGLAAYVEHWDAFCRSDQPLAAESLQAFPAIAEACRNLLSAAGGQA